MIRPSDNPFNSEALSAIKYVYGEEGLIDLLQRFETMNRQAALLGEEGHGKSTLMAELAAALEEDGYSVIQLELTSDNKTLTGSPWPAMKRRLNDKTIVCLDGADLLNRVAWNRFHFNCRKAGGLMITTQKPRMMPTLLEVKTSVDILEQVVEQCLKGEPLSADVDLEALYKEHEGDLRQVLRELYDIYSRMEAQAEAC